MIYTKTKIPDLSLEILGLIGTWRYWPFALRYEIGFNTKSYRIASSDTAQQELTHELENLVREFPETELNWPPMEVLPKRPIDSDPQINEEMLTVARLRQRPPLLVADLGWTSHEALETRSRLATFEDDWNAPGMEVYDEL